MFGPIEVSVMAGRWFVLEEARIMAAIRWPQRRMLLLRGSAMIGSIGRFHSAMRSGALGADRFDSNGW